MDPNFHLVITVSHSGQLDDAEKPENMTQRPIILPYSKVYIPPLNMMVQFSYYDPSSMNSQSSIKPSKLVDIVTS